MFTFQGLIFFWNFIPSFFYLIINFKSIREKCLFIFKKVSQKLYLKIKYLLFEDFYDISRFRQLQSKLRIK